MRFANRSFLPEGLPWFPQYPGPQSPPDYGLVRVLHLCAPTGHIEMSSIANIATEEGQQDQPGLDERRALIERVAASTHFRRSARLRDFLLYVGKQSLKDGCRAEINEQEIGVRVFGRPSSYDRSQDNIVRVNATELRKRIELYFATEGAHESLVLEIPRGGYKTVFHRRLPQTQDQTQDLLPLPPPAPPLENPPPAVGKTPVHRLHILWATSCLALAIACLVLFLQNRTMRHAIYTWDGKPTVAALWTGFVRSHQEIDIVLPDSSVSFAEEMIGQPMPLSDYLNHNYMRLPQSLNLSPERIRDLNGIFSHNLVTMGDFHAAQQILALTPLSPSLHLTFSRFYTADSVKRNSFILIGGKKANPWVRLFDDQMNFSLNYDNEHAQSVITNRHPQAGEQTSYAAAMDPNTFIGYSVIAYLPNPSRTGNVMIMAGTDSDATSAAAEFLTSEEQLSKFKSTLHLRKFPYFEVLLKTSRLSGTSFSADPLAYRIYPGLH
jgi:hypothetical protein